MGISDVVSEEKERRCEACFKTAQYFDNFFVMFESFLIYLFLFSYVCRGFSSVRTCGLYIGTASIAISIKEDPEPSETVNTCNAESSSSVIHVLTNKGRGSFD